MGEEKEDKKESKQEIKLEVDIKEEDFWTPTQIIEDAKQLRHDIFNWYDQNGKLHKSEVYWAVLDAKDEVDLDVSRFEGVDFNEGKNRKLLQKLMDMTADAQTWAMINKGQKHKDIPKQFKEREWSKQSWDMCPEPLKSMISGKITRITEETAKLFFGGQTPE